MFELFEQIVTERIDRHLLQEKQRVLAWCFDLPWSDQVCARPFITCGSMRNTTRSICSLYVLEGLLKRTLVVFPAGITSTGGGRRASAASPATRTSTSAPSVRINAAHLLHFPSLHLLICRTYIYMRIHHSVILHASFHSIYTRRSAMHSLSIMHSVIRSHCIACMACRSHGDGRRRRRRAVSR